MVPDLESARPRAMPRRRRVAAGGGGGVGVLERLRGRTGGRISGPVVTLDEPAPDPSEPPDPSETRGPEQPVTPSGDLDVRTGPDIRLRTGGRATQSVRAQRDRCLQRLPGARKLTALVWAGETCCPAPHGFGAPHSTAPHRTSGRKQP